MVLHPPPGNLPHCEGEKAMSASHSTEQTMNKELNNVVAGELPPPFFIMGCPRSGTTLVSRILDAHSRIAVYHETNYYPLFRPHLPFYGNLSKSSNLNRLITDVLESIRLQGLTTPPQKDEFRKALVAPTFEGVLTTLLHLHARQQGKAQSGEKTPRHFLYLSEILETFPESPVLFLIRDPRDTVLSNVKMFNSSIKDAAQLWNEAFLSYSRASRPVHLVRYEELVEKPGEVAEAMCTFLGEPYEPTMLSFFERIPETWRANPRVMHHPRLFQPVDRSSMGSFLRMSTQDIERIEVTCAHGMEALGYPFTIRPRVLGRKTREKLSRVNFWINRLRYYGRDWQRWRRGWFRWKMVLRVRARYLLMLGPLRNKW